VSGPEAPRPRPKLPVETMSGGSTSTRGDRDRRRRPRRLRVTTRHIVLGVVGIALGAGFILSSFSAGQVSPALSFSHGPKRPATAPDRLFFLVVGAGAL
jgi:hypothetical protein